MNRKIEFSNTALNSKSLNKISNLLDNNSNIKEIILYSSRDMKENHIKFSDSQTFNSVSELINYIDTNSISLLKSLEINIYYKNKNKATLVYEDWTHKWELSYHEQDENIDSLVYNLQPLLRNSAFKIYRQYRRIIILFISISHIILSFSYDIPKYIVYILDLIYFGYFVDLFFVKNVPYREYKFFQRKKDDIILSIIFYVLGVITPCIWSLIQQLFS